MSELAGTIAAQARDWLGLEGVAVALAIAYLVLAIRQNIACWYCGGLSTAIYVWVFFDVQLYMEAVLNIFYFAMAVYGWLSWRRDDSGAELRVSTWPASWHFGALAVIATLVAVNGYLLSTYTNAAFPYVDSATTWGAIWATFLVARKVLENWWYWLVIDAASVIIYWQRDLELSALLFAAYLVMIPIGYVSWRRTMEPRMVA